MMKLIINYYDYFVTIENKICNFHPTYKLNYISLQSDKNINTLFN